MSVTKQRFGAFSDACIVGQDYPKKSIRASPWTKRDCLPPARLCAMLARRSFHSMISGEGNMRLLRRLVLAALVLPHIPTAEAQQRQCPGGRTRIIGGETARLENWPGQAALRLRSASGKMEFYFCGGTAIADRWVLTAAHCVEPFKSKLTDAFNDYTGKHYEGSLEVVLGSGNLTAASPEAAFAVERVIVHQGYRDAELGDDIALVRLARSWTGPVALLSLSANSDPVVAPSAQVRVAGFGSIEPDFYKDNLREFTRPDDKSRFLAGSAILLETAMETVPTRQCHQVMKGQSSAAKLEIGSGQICAGLEQGGQDSCRGDSGGPLVITDEGGCPWQIGLVSWGSRKCGQAKSYGVYTRVSHYADWIQRHTGPLKGAPARLAEVAHALSQSQLDEGLKHLQALLGPAEGRVSIGVRGGNRVRLGDKVVFEAVGKLGGKLVILDINANREVVPLYPNKYVPAAKTGSIAVGQRVAVPGPDYPGFTSFQAVEPTGKGRLLALVVPTDFDIERFVANPPHLERGFAPVNDPPSYLMRIVRQIEMTLPQRARAANEGALKGWGYAMQEYEIVR